MAALTENDKRKQSGLVKMYYDANVVEVTDQGELNVKDSFSGLSVKNGNFTTLKVENSYVSSILNKVLKELRIANLYLSKISNEQISYKDLGD